MDLHGAFLVMRSGGKVRSKSSWFGEYYCLDGDEQICDHNGCIVSVDISNYTDLAGDVWEIYKEPLEGLYVQELSIRSFSLYVLTQDKWYIWNASKREWEPSGIPKGLRVELAEEGTFDLDGLAPAYTLDFI